MAAGIIELLIETDVEKSVSNTKKQEKAIKGMKGSVDKLSASFKSLLTAAGAITALKKLIDFAKDSREAADEEAAAITKRNAVLRATKSAAGLTAKELALMADNTQNLTMVSDDSAESAQAMLLTFREIGGDVFPRAMNSIYDMTELFGGLEASAVGMGKALNDPIKGVSALADKGVGFTDAQKEQIRLFQESGEMAKAQGIILEEMENQFGGTAEAMARTAKGTRVQLDNEFSDIQSSIGEGWNKIAHPNNRKLLEFVRDNKRMITGIFSNLPEVSGLAFDTVKSIIKKFISWEGISALGLSIYESLKAGIFAWPELLHSAVQFGMIPINNFGSWTKSIFDNVWVQVRNGFIDELQDLPIIGKSLFGGLEKQVVETPKTFGETWDETLSQMGEQAVVYKNTLFGTLAQIGQNLSAGTGVYKDEIEGFKTGVEEIITAAERAKEAKDALDSSSEGSLGEVETLSFAKGLHDQILELEKERTEAKKNLVVVQGLISKAEAKGLDSSSSQLTVYKEEEKKLKDILALKDEELDKMGELEKRFNETWGTEDLSKFAKGVKTVVKAMDWLKEKTEDYQGVIDSLKSTYDAWQSWSENLYDQEIEALEEKLELMEEANELLLEQSEEVYNAEIAALEEYYDNDLLTREEYLLKKAEIDAKKTAQDEKIQEEALALEEEITEKKNEEGEKQFNIQKAVSIASATIAGLQAAVQALTLGPIAGPIAATIIGGLAAAQIAMIASEEYIPQYDVGTGNIERDHLAMVHAGEGIIPKTFNDAIKSGEYSLSSGNSNNQGYGGINVNFYGDVYGDGDEITEKIFEAVEDLQDKGVLPKWQHTA